MLRWIIKTLWSQKTSLFSSAGGVALAFTLVITLDAVFVGESNQIVAYIRHSNPDVWVMQRGVGNMHMASTYVWDWKAKRVADLPGVKKATPILYLNSVIKAGDRNWFAFIVGLPPNTTRGGPWAMVSGEAIPGPGEIVLPNVISKLTGIGLGDEASIADKTFKIVGLSEGTFSMANSVAFVTFPDLEDVISASGTISYILVDAEPGQDPYKLAALIEDEVDKVSALPQAPFIKNDFDMAMMMGVEIIFFMTIIGSGLATMIIAFTAYSQVSRRRRELAISKALGVHNSSIYAATILQTLIITGLGYVIALVLALGLFPVLSALVPQITLFVTNEALFRLGLIALAVALVAALVPAYMVARVDPMTAFKV